MRHTNSWARCGACGGKGGTAGPASQSVSCFSLLSSKSTPLASVPKSCSRRAGSLAAERAAALRAGTAKIFVWLFFLWNTQILEGTWLISFVCNNGTHRSVCQMQVDGWTGWDGGRRCRARGSECVCLYSIHTDLCWFLRLKCRNLQLGCQCRPENTGTPRLQQGVELKQTYRVEKWRMCLITKWISQSYISVNITELSFRAYFTNSTVESRNFAVNVSERFRLASVTF